MSECMGCLEEYPEANLVECSECRCLFCNEASCSESHEGGYICLYCLEEPLGELMGEPIGYAGRVWILEDLVKELEAENASVKAELQALRDTFKTPRG